MIAACPTSLAIWSTRSASARIIARCCSLSSLTARSSDGTTVALLPCQFTG
jgi:hypothetical protein